MIFRHKIFLLVMLIFICCVNNIGCDDIEEDDSTYSFEVISSNGSFTGYYKVDGGSAKYFTGSSAGSDTIYYSYDNNLSSPSSIIISATADSTETTSISIYVYDDSELGDSFTETQDDSETITETLSYTFDDTTE